MASAAKAAARGPSKLSTILAQLNAAPQLNLSGVKSLRLTYAFRNDHWGARHFAKEHLPRIRWANPQLDIQVEKVLKTADQQWRPELVVERESGPAHVINLNHKWSSEIVRELMDLGGGAQWAQWKTEAAAAGLPLLPNDAPAPKSKGESFKGDAKLPSLAQFRTAHPEAAEKPVPPPRAQKPAAQPAAST